MANEKIIAHLKRKIKELKKQKESMSKIAKKNFSSPIIQTAIKAASSSGYIVLVGKISAYEEVLKELEDEGSN